MAIKVNNTDMGDAKPQKDFGRFGRPIASGKYRCIVDKIKDDAQALGDPTCYGFQVTLRTKDAPLDKAPEGQVKIDWYVFPRCDTLKQNGKPVSDGSELRQFCEAFEPRALTPEGYELEGVNYEGRECDVYINWNATAGKEGKGKAFVNRVTPVPGNQGDIAPKAENVAAASEEPPF